MVPPHDTAQLKKNLIRTINTWKYCQQTRLSLFCLSEVQSARRNLQTRKQLVLT